MKKMLSGLIRFGGIGVMGYSIYLIVFWYVKWLGATFFPTFQAPQIIIGLLTFFLAPFAAIFDIILHAPAPETLDAFLKFLGYFVGGRIIFWVGDRMRKRL